MKYQRKSFSVAMSGSVMPGTGIWDKKKEDACETTKDQPSSDTSPVAPADPKTTLVYSATVTPIASGVEITVKGRKVAAVRYEDGEIEWLVPSSQT